jgi:hypothetical protein
MYCGQLECSVCNWNVLCVIVLWTIGIYCVCFSMAGFLRNSIDFLFKASGIWVAELSVNAAELSVNSAELSAYAAKFRFSKRLLFISHVKCVSTEF